MAVDYATKILTLDGWRNGDEVSVGNAIWTVSPITGRLTGDTITSVINGVDDVNIISLPEFSAAFTDDHAWYVFHSSPSGIVDTKTLGKCDGSYLSVASAAGERVFVPRQGFDAQEQTDIMSLRFNKNYARYLIAGVAGDGYSTNETGVVVVKVPVSSFASAYIKKLNIEYSLLPTVSGEGGDTIVFTYPELPIVDSPVPTTECCALMHGLLHAACGHHGNEQYACPMLKDTEQEEEYVYMAYLAGGIPLRLTDGRIALKRKAWVRVNKYSVERIQDTPVWNVTTGTGTWVARRNGTIYLTGGYNESSVGQ